MFALKEYVTQCNDVAHWCIFIVFGATLELCGTEEETVQALTTQVCTLQIYLKNAIFVLVLFYFILHSCKEHECQYLTNLAEKSFKQLQPDNYVRNSADD